MEGDQVWVVTTWSAHSEDGCVFGVFVNREAAFEALKDVPNMTVWVDNDGLVRGRPRKERDWSAWRAMSGQRWLPEKWALGKPVTVQGRKPVPTQAQ